VVCNNFAFITSFLFDTDSENENEEFDLSDQPRRPARLKVRKNEKGETQLHLSCISGNLALVKKLIEQVGHTESGNFLFTWSDN
jgi:NF-kappa-B inhibitor-like protein 2